MRKVSVIISMGIALSISASVLSGCGDSENKEIVEKKTVFYTIKKAPEVAVKPLVTVSPTPTEQTIEGQGTLPQKESTPLQARAIAEKKMADLTPVKKSEPLENLQKATLQKKEAIINHGDSLKKARFWLYNAADGDTLWDIAKKYYGKGIYYPVLLEHNPHVGIYGIGKGVALNILKTGENVSEIYKSIIIRKNGHNYWRYCVARGDTFESIVEKYYKKRRTKSDIPNLDKTSELKPGEKIWILIE